MRTSSINSGWCSIQSIGAAHGVPRPILTSVIPARPAQTHPKVGLESQHHAAGHERAAIPAMIGLVSALHEISHQGQNIDAIPRPDLGGLLEIEARRETPQPDDVSSATRAAVSALRRAQASVSSFIASKDSAFLRSGRSMVTVGDGVMHGFLIGHCSLPVNSNIC